MTGIEMTIMQFISERSEMCAILPTKCDIRKHVGSPDADHAVNDLWGRKLIEAYHIRKAHAPYRFQLTPAGRAALAGKAAA